MSQETIRVVAQVTALQDKIAEVQAILEAIVPPTRQEAGCLHYQLCKNRDDPTEFLFIEEWINQAAIDAHFTKPHLQEALAKAMPLLVGAPNIQKYSLLV